MLRAVDQKGGHQVVSFKGKGSQTVKAAKVDAARTSGTQKPGTAQQDQIGVRYTDQKHECTTGANGCDNPCPLAHPTA